MACKVDILTTLIKHTLPDESKIHMLVRPFECLKDKMSAKESSFSTRCPGVKRSSQLKQIPSCNEACISAAEIRLGVAQLTLAIPPILPAIPITIF
ncbi:hypothetical protein CKAN_00264100 [Cinnamomum micranthum f. kanehirae]|uniref:Ethylene insensitive 3-like DNA-binding domain-containing protein n=1 Tax=Cinnamomum micranthum f. kanehirae TaxID=337451 RepID=A0A443N747_9MAGN|nr:hypothetical protein CKAN_00264100 [Cinnamomum micranthum f. kanehirae]